MFASDAGKKSLEEIKSVFMDIGSAIKTIAPYLIVIGYIILTLDIRINLLIFLLILWILFILIYSLRTNKKVGSLVKKIVECCKEW